MREEQPFHLTACYWEFARPWCPGLDDVNWNTSRDRVQALANIDRYGLFELLALPLAIVVVIVTFALLFRDSVLYAEARAEAQQTERVISATSALLSALTDAETGQRGYLLTGRDEYLQPYNSALGRVRRNMDLLGRTVARPANRARIPRLRQLVEDKLSEVKKTIDLQHDRGKEAALTVVLSGHGKALMDEIRGLGPSTRPRRAHSGCA